MNNHRCGFVALMGPTNSGKSTLLNALMKQKLSIVSPLPQTTLRVVKGILSREASQVIFVDTPGLTQKKETFTRQLNHLADKSAKDCDVIVWVFDVSKSSVLDQIERLKKNVQQFKTKENRICVLNKVDRVEKPSLLPLMEKIFLMDIFDVVIPISARKGDGVTSIENELHSRVPVGPPLFPKQQKTDRSEDFLISEIVREKIYQLTKEEVPYSTWIEVENWDRKQRVPTINVALHVDSQSRKAIIIGKNGQMLKEVGIRARKDVEALLGHQVCLKLFAHHQPNWKKDSRQLKQYLEL